MNTTQTYANHVRWYPLFHFVIVPILVLVLAYFSVRVFQEPSWDRAMFLLFVIAVVLINFSSRLHGLKAQDRLIRLEERLRYSRVLDAELAAAASDLPEGKIISLRFASDDELSELSRRVIDGELRTAKEIKMAIKNWRGDYFRV